MSYDVNVISLSPRLPTWREVAESLAAMGVEGARLGFLNARDAAEPSLPLAPGEIYGVEVGGPTSITVMPYAVTQELTPTGDLELLEGLSPALQERVTAGWLEAGYGVMLTTAIGRERFEPKVIAALAASLALLTNGYVLLETGWRLSSPGLRRGIYEPRVFLSEVAFDALPGPPVDAATRAA